MRTSLYYTIQNGVAHVELEQAIINGKELYIQALIEPNDVEFGYDEIDFNLKVSQVICEEYIEAIDDVAPYDITGEEILAHLKSLPNRAFDKFCDDVEQSLIAKYQDECDDNELERRLDLIA